MHLWILAVVPDVTQGQGGAVAQGIAHLRADDPVVLFSVIVGGEPVRWTVGTDLNTKTQFREGFFSGYLVLTKFFPPLLDFGKPFAGVVAFAVTSLILARMSSILLAAEVD